MWYFDTIFLIIYEFLDVFDNDIDLRMLRVHITEDFLLKFSDGLKFYLSGDWTLAREYLETADRIMRDNTRMLNLIVTGDGPSLTLLRFMSESDWTAPKDWKGFRPLTAK